VPHFPDAVAEVNAWLESLGVSGAERRPELELGERCAVWRLGVHHMVLGDTKPFLVLMQDFPARPARVLLSSSLCLRLPHVEEDGNFCHGVEADGSDIEDPKAAVGRVLARLDDFLKQCVNAGWREAEFQRERLNYWSRLASSAKHPAAAPASELLLDAGAVEGTFQVIPTILLADDRRALAASGDAQPEAVAKARDWAVGTITRGATLVIHVSGEVIWTPSTWPESFSAINEFASAQTGEQDLVANWYFTNKWPNKAPLFIVVQEASAAFAWSVVPHPVQKRADPTVIPVAVTRVDRTWALSRGHHTHRLAQRTSQRVAVLGAGSIGAAVAELLVRGGVGDVELVDSEDFEVENISRHLLGMGDIGKPKAQALATRLRKAVTANIRGEKQTASNWAASLNRATSRPDLVVDCTGERAVRLAMSQLRGAALRGVPVVMGWMEPFGAAAHVVLTAQDDRWPASDPTDTHINYGIWPKSTFIALPACGQGFHDYGVSDAWTAASLVAEIALDTLSSAVWSRVRSHAFFESKAPGMTFTRELPCPPGIECVVVRRSLEEALRGS
jgi:hypothetical protein